MYILGFDVGSRNLGYSICNFTNEKPILVEANSEYLSDPKIENRLVYLHEKIDSLITEYPISTIGYEAPYMKINNKSTMGLYFIAGLIVFKAAFHNLPVISLSAATVKKEVTGSGKAEKIQVEKAVLNYFQITKKFKTDHASDAAAICIATYKQLEIV